MATLKLPKSERVKLIDAVNNGEGVALKLSSRMIVDPDDGVNGSVTIPLTATQMSKLEKSVRATNFNLSKTQIKKLVKGNGFLGSLWKGIKTGAKAVANVGEKVVTAVAPKVLDKLVDTAVAAAPALLLGAGTKVEKVDMNPVPVRPKGRKIKGSVGVAAFRQATNELAATKSKMKGKGIGDPILNAGGMGGQKGDGKMKRMDAPPKVNQNVSANFHISGT